MTRKTIILILAVSFFSAALGSPAFTRSRSTFARSQDERSFTPLQLEIAKQRERLNSAEMEERRDAVTRLGAMRRAEASRAALAALNDVSAIVRVTAAGAILFLPGDEAAAALIPLLNDKDEFVRQEVAYALGRTGSKTAVAPLIERLMKDKKHGVRGAAAVSLGRLGDESAVVPLANVLAPTSSNRGRGSRNKDNVFVLRATAVSLGQIRSRAAIPGLIATLEDEKTETDVRREAARALGLIGDPAAEPALRKLTTASDAHLALTAYEALRRISNLQKGLPGS
ncbi:MAG TPA: HEAT repeat domain-containing protein [Pyrinomonadaceae bacterium]|nr:HEAT repeat domain-containing protein [Pyrinomonadaceae bacterium]